MTQYSNFTRTDLENGWTVCDDVHFPSGSVSKVFLSSCGIYVLSRGCCSPKAHYLELQTILNSTKIRLFLTYEEDGLFGLYDPIRDLLFAQMNDEALTEDVNAWLTEGVPVYDEDAIERILARIKSTDIKARGYYAKEEGKFYVLRHGKLLRATTRSSDKLYYLTLFTGVLGVHRFALGKIFSGLVYFFTGGFFLVGWLTDLLQLFLGATKDARKRYILPLSNLKLKLLVLPVGLIAGVFLFLFYRYVCNMISDLFNSMIAYELNNADPQQIQSFTDFLINGFSN